MSHVVECPHAYNYKALHQSIVCIRNDLNQSAKLRIQNESMAILQTVNERLLNYHWFPNPRWSHQKETFSALLAICAGNSLVTGGSPHEGQWRGALMFSLICALNKQLKQSWALWVETTSRPWWRHCNAWFRVYYPHCIIFITLKSFARSLWNMNDMWYHIKGYSY